MLGRKACAVQAAAAIPFCQALQMVNLSHSKPGGRGVHPEVPVAALRAAEPCRAMCTSSVLPLLSD